MINYFRSVSYTKKIDTSVDELWEIISKPGNLNYVHPYCKKNEIIEWCGEGSKDVLIYLNGLTYFREFTNWDNQVGYSLLIGRKRGPKSKVIWKITSTNNSVFLTITVFPYLLSHWPKFFSWLPFVTYIKPNLENYLRSVVGGINWYLINKEPVSKNHLGKHPWFSKF